jgi:anti-sigma regulatory factor (Ser/Thr protein kinase)
VTGADASFPPEGLTAPSIPQFEATEAFPPAPTSARRARHFVRVALNGRALSDQIDVAVLLVSELVTNAVTHAKTTVRVTISVTMNNVKVAVTDEDATTPDVGREPGLDECGRGMAIVHRLASVWGVAARPPGKTVWFALNGPVPKA